MMTPLSSSVVVSARERDGARFVDVSIVNAFDIYCGFSVYFFWGVAWCGSVLSFVFLGKRGCL